jgi:hypothetical protein
MESDQQGRREHRPFFTEFDGTGSAKFEDEGGGGAQVHTIC